MAPTTAISPADAQTLALAADSAQGGGPVLALIAFMACLLVGSAAASGSETALFGLTHGERLALRRTSPAKAAILDQLLSTPRRLLICVLLLNMVFNVLYFAAAALLLQTTRTPLMGVLAAVLPLVMIILFGEILAKLMADAYRTQWSRLAAGPLRAVSSVFGGLLMGIDSLVVAPLARLIAPGPVEVHARLSDVRDLLRAGAYGGAIDEHERALLEGVVGLSAVRARAVMTPRVDLEAVSTDLPMAQLAQVARRTGMERLCVMDDRGLVIRGIIDVRGSLARGRPIVEKPIYVPENARLDRVLEQLREHGTRTAVCVDEHGESTGTLEITDVLRALVGLPSDPAKKDANGMIMVALGCWSVPGRTPVDALNLLFEHHHKDGFPWPAEAVTIAGAVMAQLGRMAVAGDKARFGPLQVEVEQVQGRSIDRVLVRTTETQEAQGEPTP